MHPAKFWDPLEDNKVQCLLCARRCRIPPGKTGFCRVRRNVEGKLQTLVYGRMSAMHTDPIEKKPLYHFHPGSSVFSYGSVGCNFRCLYCQNHHISQVSPDDYPLVDTPGPAEAVRHIRRNVAQGVAFTYNEPTLMYEFAYDACRLVKEAGYYTVFVSNGYMQEDPLREIGPYLDAMNVDVKAFRDDLYMKMSGSHLQPVLDTCILCRELDIFLELVTLLVPDFNDDEPQLREYCRWVIENLGPHVPVHFLRYRPEYRYNAPPTPLSTLVKAYDIAKEEGLENVYLGNTRHGKYENTWCPSCGALAIKRTGRMVETFFKAGPEGTARCASCGADLHVITGAGIGSVVTNRNL